MKWDPRQYLRHGDERGRPFFELTDRIGADRPRIVVDLGCGPGNQTALLSRRWPAARILGVDSSAEMIATARAEAVAAEESTGGLAFVIGDISQWRPDPETDVVVSNAALQWVPGHHQLIRQWTGTLPSGGVAGISGAWQLRIAVSSADARTRRVRGLAGRVGRCAPSRRRRRRRGRLRPPAAGLRLVRRRVGDHLRACPAGPGPGAGRGTGLRPVLAALEPDAAREFETEYAAMLRQAYPRRAAGTLFPFRRIFCVGNAP